MILLLSLLISAALHPSISLTTNCVDEKENAWYDYIVIGSGPGGATVATRLALNDFKVLLIEAGPDYDDIVTRTPVFWPDTYLNPKITARFNPYLYSEDEGIKIEYPRGITLGGSTQINVMIAIMANPSEWDHIEQVTNDPTWNSANIQKKYQPLVENCQYCDDNDKNSNKNGWLNISMSNDPFQSSSLFSQNDALRDLWNAFGTKLPYNPDANRNNTYDSYFYTPISVDKNNTRLVHYHPFFPAVIE